MCCLTYPRRALIAAPGILLHMRQRGNCRYEGASKLSGDDNSLSGVGAVLEGSLQPGQPFPGVPGTSAWGASFSAERAYIELSMV